MIDPSHQRLDERPGERLHETATILCLSPDVMTLITPLARTHDGTLFCNSSAACSVGRIRGTCKALSLRRESLTQRDGEYLYLA